MFQVVGGKRNFSSDQLEESELILNDLDSRKKGKIGDVSSLNRALDFQIEALLVNSSITNNLVSATTLRSADQKQ